MGPISQGLRTGAKSTGLLLALCCLSGCGLSLNPSIGPTVEKRVTFVKYKGIAGRITEKTIALVGVQKEDGTVDEVKMDIGGFYVISPDMKDDGTPKMGPTKENGK